MQPPCLHSSFFSSLKQLEKRLKLEHQSVPSNSSSQPIPQTNTNLTPESLSSPMFLHLDQTKSNSIKSAPQESSNSESEPPPAFLPLSPEFPPTQQNPPHANPTTTHQQESNDFDDIQMLMQLLGLSDSSEEGNEEEERVGLGSCKCSDSFYEKIVGVVGPKCEKELERMEGWIKYFLGKSNGEEPLRLAYLLLGKAAFASEGDDCGLGGLEFPPAVDEFLKNDHQKSKVYHSCISVLIIVYMISYSSVMIFVYFEPIFVL